MAIYQRQILRQTFENSHEFMLPCTPNSVNETDGQRPTVSLRILVEGTLWQMFRLMTVSLRL